MTFPFSIESIFLVTGLCLFLHVCLWGVIGICKKRADLADIAWGLGFFLISWVSFFLSPFSLYTLIVNLLITAWSFRLAIHIYLRNQNRPEDFRYQKLKEKWGRFVSIRIFFQVFFLQGIILYVVALPILWINTHPDFVTFNALWFGAPFWLTGFLLETIGDHQLLRFQRNPSNKGKLLKTGFWSYVRHPNYLGEIAQWWSIWSLTLFIPMGWIFFISPLLLTFLIVKVSGVAPLEERMKTHPEFRDYSKQTPALIPFSFVNGSLYTVSWLIIVFSGAKGSFLTPLFTAVCNYAVQTYLTLKYDLKSFLVSVPLSIYAFFMGLIQETCFIHLGLLAYPDEGFLPPFWLLSLYPLFSLTLNPSLSFLNNHLPLCFFLGGFGALLSYLSGQRLGGVHILSPLTYLITYVSWGLLLTLLVFLNRKLIVIREKYTDPRQADQTLTVFFDGDCPVCAREMKTLKKRKQTAPVIYAAPQSDEDLKKLTTSFSYEQAMKKIHAIDGSGNILTGIDALSALYARTDLPVVAILLQAPGFRPLFSLSYAIWAKFRKRLRDC